MRSMTGEQWESIYDRAWHLYYSPQHIETLIKRAIGSGINPARLTSMIFTFYASHAFEKVHPLQSGALRRKRRKDRRHELPRESPLVFIPAGPVRFSAPTCRRCASCGD